MKQYFKSGNWYCFVQSTGAERVRTYSASSKKQTNRDSSLMLCHVPHHDIIYIHLYFSLKILELILMKLTPPSEREQSINLLFVVQ